MTSTLVPQFYAKVGETFAPLATLRGAPNDDGTPGPVQDLTAAVGVVMSLRPRGGGTPVYDNVACAVVGAAANGQASFQSPAVIGFDAGYYEMDFTVDFGAGVKHKFPDGGPNGDKDAFLLVKISESAGT